MSFQLIIGKKPVIFKSGVRMNKQLNKISNMVFLDDEGNKMMGLAGTGKIVVNQFISAISEEEVDANTILELLSDLLFAMQNEIKKEEIEGFIDGIDSEEELSNLVQKVYDELPKNSKKLQLRSANATAATASPSLMQ